MYNIVKGEHLAQIRAQIFMYNIVKGEHLKIFSKNSISIFSLDYCDNVTVGSVSYGLYTLPVTPIGSNITHKCIYGSKNEEEDKFVRFCQAGGTWSSTDLPECLQKSPTSKISKDSLLKLYVSRQIYPPHKILYND